MPLIGVVQLDNRASDFLFVMHGLAAITVDIASDETANCFTRGRATLIAPSSTGRLEVISHRAGRQVENII
jgi:hypothetical protein